MKFSTVKEKEMEGVSRGHSAEHAIKELTATIRRLESELSQRKRVEEELYLLVAALESRIDQGSDQLTASHQKLRLENRTRVEDQNEICRLREALVKREHAFAIVDRELETLSYGISHDLRSPLRHLIGFSSALSEDFADTLDDAAKRYLDAIVRAGRKMESFLEALLRLSRVGRQELKIVGVDLSSIARGCLATLRDQAPGREVTLTVPDQLPVLADEELIKSAIGNLVANAWKFTAKRSDAAIELGCKDEKGGRLYFVKDNGVGFDMQFADKLFGPFQRMHSESEFQGDGIGLAIVQRIIHRHGGRIWAEAAVDSGATFYFTLPDRSTLDG